MTNKALVGLNGDGLECRSRRVSLSIEWSKGPMQVDLAGVCSCSFFTNLIFSVQSSKG